MVLFFIELSSRRVQIAVIAATADAFWMSQIARNLTDAVDGLLKGKRYLIQDRDPLFTSEFLSTLDEILDESAASSRNRRNPRGVKRKMSNFPLRRSYKRSPLSDISAAHQNR
jgi:hypothetical protein